jgi:ABC-type cobalt transport system substrate-binding protein
VSADDLKRLFRELRSEEERGVPQFGRQPVRRAPAFRALPAVAAVVLLFLVVLVAVRVRVRHTTFSGSDRAVARAVAEWQPPTEFLLRTPGGEILTTTPAIPEVAGVLSTTKGVSQ